MPLSVGEKLPDVPVAVITPNGPEERSHDELFAGKKVVLFALPGAFTPTCDNNHLPGYGENADEIKAKGVDMIAVLSVNDVHVMKAWKEASGYGDAITFLADGSAKFTKAADMVLDGTDFGMGIRSLRYSALIEDGVVTRLGTGDGPGQYEAAGAETMLAMLDDK